MEYREKYYASIDAIKQLNNLESDYVSEGDRLLIVNLRVSDIVDIIMKSMLQNVTWILLWL